MTDKETVAPEPTAVRVALWRALHVLIDPLPHLLTDEMGLKLIAPDENWRLRPDMDPQNTKRFRASIVGRARFIEDLVEDQLNHGVRQYVILGAGLDTFAQRKPEVAARLQIFEVDQCGPQEWKRKRLEEIGFTIPEYLRFVPVNFEAQESWWEKLASAGFDRTQPAVVVSTGVSMYLTKEANIATLEQLAKLAPGSTFATTFILPLELLNSEDRPGLENTMKYARLAGTPFISLFAPSEMMDLANKAGFKKSEYFSSIEMRKRYFAGRTDDFHPGSGEEFLIART